MRKTPFKHEVNTHIRVTPKTKRKVKVKTYKRGEGKPPTPEIFKHKKTVDGFSVNINYADGGSVSGEVKGNDYREGISKGINLAKKKQVRSITLTKTDSVEVN